MTPFFGTIGTILLLLAALVAARLALRTARSPQGATGWVVFLLSFPLLALPAYAVFGGMYRMNRHNTPKTHPADDAAPRITDARLSDLQDALDARLKDGNSITLLKDGPDTFDAIFDAIDRARSEILIQYYTLNSDALGQRLKSHLLEARARGVSVRVLVDAMGSLWLDRGYIRELRDAGVEFRGNFSFRRSFYRLGLNFRNHRKTIVVDGEHGFTGGLNAAQPYVDGGESFETWRDTFLHVRGPVVAQLRACFAQGWRAVTEEDLTDIAPPQACEGGVRAMHVAVGPTGDRETGKLLMLGLIAKARRRLWITSPYLVPPPEISAALQLAALRGVEVRILIPRALDKYLPWLASRAPFATLHDHGVAIHEYEPGFLHQKVVLIDDDIASIGTVNLDFRSVMLNFEQTVLIEDKGFCAQVDEMLQRDFEDGTAYDGARLPLPVRVFAPVAQLFAPVL